MYSISKGFVLHSLSALVSGLRKKYTSSKIIPSYKKHLYHGAIRAIRKEKEFSLPLSYSVDSDDSTSVDHLRIRLATMTYDLQESPSWDLIAEDPEDVYSLNRFGWLLPVLISTGALRSLPLLQKVILYWINKNYNNHEGPGWDSYSISERCVNWLYIISYLGSTSFGDKSLVIKIRNSLRDQISTLQNQLEFRGSSTNNHLINNARALYLTGNFLGNMEAVQIGRNIASHASKTMFSQSGFLKEGSVHYHVLLCRTYLELYWMARRTGDHAFLEILIPHVKKLMSAALFFMSESSLPLIGDVSPDYPTSFHFLLPALLENKNDNWYSLFGEQLKEFEPMREQNRGLVSSPDAGYYRFSNESYTVFIYVHPMNHIPAWSHGHADIGGFIMYWRHKPFLVDTGRLRYRNDAMGRYGRSVRSHNSISINGKEPVVIHGLNGYPQLMYSNYFQPAPDVSSEKRGSIDQLRIVFHGFARYIKSARIVRTFSFLNTHLRIEDQISGEGYHQVESFFHFAPEVNTQMDDGQEIQCFLDGQSLKLRAQSSDNVCFMGYRGAEVPSPAGWHSPEYGQALPTWTLINRQKKLLPICNRYDIGIFTEI